MLFGKWLENIFCESISLLLLCAVFRAELNGAVWLSYQTFAHEYSDLRLQLRMIVTFELNPFFLRDIYSNEEEQ